MELLLPHYTQGKKYDVILADPPWGYRAKQKQEPFRRVPYPTLTTSRLCRIPVEDIASDECVLLLWTTRTHIFECNRVIEAWGFEGVTVLAVWHKQCKMNLEKPLFGLGFYTRGSHEFLMLARRKNGSAMSNRTEDKSIPDRIVASIQEHSRKPDATFELIDRLFGTTIPRIELFARQHRPGWDAWGLDIAGYYACASTADVKHKKKEEVDLNSFLKKFPMEVEYPKEDITSYVKEEFYVTPHSVPYTQTLTPLEPPVSPVYDVAGSVVGGFGALAMSPTCAVAGDIPDGGCGNSASNRQEVARGLQGIARNLTSEDPSFVWMFHDGSELSQILTTFRRFSTKVTFYVEEHRRVFLIPDTSPHMNTLVCLDAAEMEEKSGGFWMDERMSTATQFSLDLQETSKFITQLQNNSNTSFMLILTWKSGFLPNGQPGKIFLASSNNKNAGQVFCHSSKLLSMHNKLTYSYTSPVGNIPTSISMSKQDFAKLFNCAVMNDVAAVPATHVHFVFGGNYTEFVSDNDELLHDPKNERMRAIERDDEANHVSHKIAIFRNWQVQESRPTEEKEPISTKPYALYPFQHAISKTSLKGNVTLAYLPEDPNRVVVVEYITRTCPGLIHFVVTPSTKKFYEDKGDQDFKPPRAQRSNKRRRTAAKSKKARNVPKKDASKLVQKFKIPTDFPAPEPRALDSF